MKHIPIVFDYTVHCALNLQRGPPRGHAISQSGQETSLLSVDPSDRGLPRNKKAVSGARLVAKTGSGTGKCPIMRETVREVPRV